MKYSVLLYYKYVAIKDPEAFSGAQKALCEKLGLKGRILISKGGINGTVGGMQKATDAYIEAMRQDPRFTSIDFKESIGSKDVFPKLSVKVRDEIVTLGTPDDPKIKNSGKHLNPEEFHEFIQKEDVVVLDARNNYESAIGKFKNAVTPDIQAFKEFPKYIEQNKKRFKNKKVAMYCTGGIRCEKASALVKEKADADVYQLQGGIQRYGEKFPEGEWQGEMFVFDGRMKFWFKDNPERLGKCVNCQNPTNEFMNCAHKPCNALTLMCKECQKVKNTCSKTCVANLIKTPTLSA
ncbi:MAG: rhodanese-related sulfurtransferase [Candidatus Saccharimonadales bacterium]